MKVLVSGASGLLGTHLMRRLRTDGHDPVALTRVRHKDDPFWDIDRGTLDLGSCRSPDAIVHLTGAGIADGRWSDSRKAAIRDSRIRSTLLLSRKLAALSTNKPRVLISASAIGYYGNRGAEILHEASPPGAGFLADVCRDWEASTAPASDAGIRTIHLRTGIVLAREGGALPRMLTPFRLGAGGIIGNGRQYMSWIHIDDLVAAIAFLIAQGDIRGAVNMTAPGATTNLEFTRSLGRVLRRPTVLPLPALAVRLLFGEMGDALLLSSARVEPRQLTQHAFAFTHPALDGALTDLLTPTPAAAAPSTIGASTP